MKMHIFRTASTLATGSLMMLAASVATAQGGGAKNRLDRMGCDAVTTSAAGTDSAQALRLADKCTQMKEKIAKLEIRLSRNTQKKAKLEARLEKAKAKGNTNNIAKLEKLIEELESRIVLINARLYGG